ncbi:MAG: NAD(P)(+) transhydrogenase (Re/Si-specific) subunit beta [Candidatus Kapabacteria bacterium]|nr:NAD(P)(+) transhydrogenase (Re/Si-specific) subunit beta [Candidatus Kapabacteria bacterium]
MMDSILPILYLLASVSFILGLKMLGSPATARRGNLIAAFGMGLAIFGTIFLYKGHTGGHLHNLPLIFGGLVVGTVIGMVMAKRVKMTAMPQMVSFFNGMGGACAALISLIEEANRDMAMPHDPVHSLTVIAGLVIGGVSFSGSMIAFGKLAEKIKDLSFSGQQIINILVLAGIVVMSAMFIMGSISGLTMLLVLCTLALAYGVLFVMPIGGADMPVVISLLNSFTGVAAACGGFLYDNMVMLIGGILVGSAGTILTIIMCKAMNRSLFNVLFGGLMSAKAASGTSRAVVGNIREVSATDAAVLMAYAKQVVIVPGYSLAVAQAQHTCHQLELELESKGVVVKYAVHPVAGRMPGHMNVLLAEADVSYDKLVEMEEINPEFATTDVVLVVGANDVVNPAAKTDPDSPIYGMPILDVESSRQVIVMKRSMKAGYAGIENELFYRPNTSMLFGDAKKSLAALVNEVKAL